MTMYCTLADVRAEMLAESTVDDDKVVRLIRQVSRRIDRKFQSNVPLFAPYIEARDIPLNGYNINSGNRTLTMRTAQGGVSPLLSLTSVNTDGTALVIGTNVRTFPAGLAPYYQLQLLGSTWNSWYSTYCSDAWNSPYTTIAGVWGYNADYAHAWLEVDTLTAAITTTTGTTFTVFDVDGDNPYDESPRISVGNLVQIDSEWMDVVAVDDVNSLVTVVRGVNGSTAATHAIDAPVSVYLVDENIRRAVTRQTAFLYARQGAFDTVRVGDFSTVVFPSDMLTEVNALLSLFANM